MAVRKADGRPTAGMVPKVKPASGASGGRMTTLIVKKDPAITMQLRHMVRQTQDPAERYASALRFFAAAYYQEPESFADEITALCGKDFALAEQLLQKQDCVLAFEQYSQRFHITCRVRETAKSDPLFQATYWHNSLFNANLPAGVRVLALRPHWQTAAADSGAG
jgi:hypothetical protein